jgi:hypothetical protein
MKKSIDVLAQRILAIGISFAMILAVTLFGISTITNNSARADSPTATNTTGKIMMSESGFALGGKAIYNVLVWDSETGKSKVYGFNGIDKMVVASYQLPSSPLY